MTDLNSNSLILFVVVGGRGLGGGADFVTVFAAIIEESASLVIEYALNTPHFNPRARVRAVAARVRQLDGPADGPALPCYADLRAQRFLDGEQVWLLPDAQCRLLQ